MKKLFILFIMLTSLQFKAQYMGTYGFIDNGPNTGGTMYWQYSWDGGINYSLAYIMQFDSAFIRLRPLDNAVVSVNTNTRLTGVSSDGTLSPFDIDSLPFRPASYSPTLTLTGRDLSAGSNTITIPSSTYTNSDTVTGGAGNVIFYLTSDKTSTGTALYGSMPTVIPIVNDASTNYTYQWTLSGDFKTLTVNVKSSPGLVVGLLTLLGVPVNVANGTEVRVTVN
jgi:hypothetical protein